MKKTLIISLIFIAVLFFSNTAIIAVETEYKKAKTINITYDISNIDHEIESIELVKVEKVDPSELLDYKIETSNGYFYNNNKINFIWDDLDNYQGSLDTIVVKQKTHKLYDTSKKLDDNYILLYDINSNVSYIDYDIDRVSLNGITNINDIHKENYVANKSKCSFYDLNKNVFSIFSVKDKIDITTYDYKYSFEKNVLKAELENLSEEYYLLQINLKNANPVYLNIGYNFYPYTVDPIEERDLTKSIIDMGFDKEGKRTITRNFDSYKVLSYNEKKFLEKFSLVFIFSYFITILLITFGVVMVIYHIKRKRFNKR